MYQRSDGHRTGNVQQGKAFDRQRGVASKGPGGAEHSHTGHPQGTADLAEGVHETQPHPMTGVHAVHIRHYGDGHYTVHAFHEPIPPHPDMHKATSTDHHGEDDMHMMAQEHFPNDGDETGEESGSETLSGITGGMPGSNEEGPHRRGY